MSKKKIIINKSTKDMSYSWSISTVHTRFILISGPETHTLLRQVYNMTIAINDIIIYINIGNVCEKNIFKLQYEPK